jgi:hypothetical protein
VIPSVILTFPPKPLCVLALLALKNFIDFVSLDDEVSFKLAVVGPLCTCEARKLLDPGITCLTCFRMLSREAISVS